MSETQTDVSQMDVSQMKITKFRAFRWDSQRYKCELTVSLGEKEYVLTVGIYDSSPKYVVKKAREWRNQPGNQERVLAAIKAGLNHVPPIKAN